MDERNNQVSPFHHQLLSGPENEIPILCGMHVLLDHQNQDIMLNFTEKNLHFLYNPLAGLFETQASRIALNSWALWRSIKPSGRPIFFGLVWCCG